MSKYIDAEKLIATLERQNVDKKVIEPLIRIIDSLQQEQPTCKTCGFYENNCPFIRGKLIPYPNKVCKDYTSSAMKEQEQNPKVMQEVSDNVDKLRAISTPAEEDWFKISEEWEKEDKKSATWRDELEDAANNYISPIENEQGLSFIGFSGQDIKDAFKAGAEWQYQKDRYEFAKLKAKEWCNGYDAALSQFVKIPYEPRDWFSSNDGDFICGASFDEAIPAKVELYYRTELEEK